jgi:hypothetical protein
MDQKVGRTGRADGLMMKNQKNKNWLTGRLAELILGYDEK